MRRLTVFLAVLAAVAAIGVVVMRIGSHESTASTDAVVDDHQPQLSLAEPSDDIEDARIAAVAAVALTDDVARAGFISRRELIESFTILRTGRRWRMRPRRPSPRCCPTSASVTSIRPIFTSSSSRFRHVALVLAKSAIAVTLVVGVKLLANAGAPGADGTTDGAAALGTLISGFACFAIAGLSP